MVALRRASPCLGLVLLQGVVGGFGILGFGGQDRRVVDAERGDDALVLSDWTWEY